MLSMEFGHLWVRKNTCLSGRCSEVGREALTDQDGAFLGESHSEQWLILGIWRGKYITSALGLEDRAGCTSASCLLSVATSPVTDPGSLHTCTSWLVPVLFSLSFHFKSTSLLEPLT